MLGEPAKPLSLFNEAKPPQTPKPSFILPPLSAEENLLSMEEHDTFRNFTENINYRGVVKHRRMTGPDLEGLKYSGVLTVPNTPSRGTPPPLRRSSSFLDGFGASIGRSLEFGMEKTPTSDLYLHLYRKDNPEFNQEPPSHSSSSNWSAEGVLSRRNTAYEQAQLLLVSLLENFCALYDRNPDKNKRLFLAVCRQLWNMGILTSADFFTRSERLRGVYKEAFRTLVLEAINGIEVTDLAAGLSITRGDSSNSNLQYLQDEEEEDVNFVKPNNNGTFEVTPMGSRLESEFRDLETIGKGGFALVFKGEHRIDHCKYAFKRIEFKSKASDSYEKIIREIKSLAQLEHPHVVRYHGAWVEEKIMNLPNDKSAGMIRSVVEVEDDDSTISTITPSSMTASGISIPIANEACQFEMDVSLGYYMIIQMELCQFTLADWLEQRNYLIFNSKPWSSECSSKTIKSRFNIPADKMATMIEPNKWSVNAEENCRIFKCIVKALQYIHSKGIIHRDLKPGNILFQVDRNQLIPKIGDFGLASDSSQDSPLFEQSLNFSEDVSIFQSPSPSVKSSGNRTSGVGTCMYAAPEQIRDCDYTEKVDIYSLGIIMFELFFPFATRMERHDVLEDLKSGIIPPSFVKRWPKEATFIWSCISPIDTSRPSAEQILESEILEQDPEDIIDRLSIENTNLKRLLEGERERAKLLEQVLAQQRETQSP